MKFCVCKKCGNMVEFFKKSGCNVFCCGEEMHELKAGTTDAATEKHVPVVNVEGDKVTVEVGSVEHPMMENHFIQWIVVETNRGSQRVNLEYTDKPKAEFKLAEGENFVAAYEYCNLHGLWKAE